MLRASLMSFVLCAGIAAAATQPGDWVINHVTVVDPSVGKPRPDLAVVIRGTRIVRVAPASEFKTIGGMTIIDGTGKFLLPGLWDMHTHFRDPDNDLAMDIANGVLGIRDMGGVASEVFALREAIASGKRLGPKIEACGPIVDGPDSSSNPRFTLSVHTSEDARAAVKSLKAQGADFIKVYDQLSREEYLAIADEAKKQRIPFAGHVPSAISVREASDAGQRTIEHGVALAGGSSVEQAYIQKRVEPSAFQEAMRTKNFSLIPAKIARDETYMLDHFDQALANATYKLLAANETYLTPTLVTQRALTFVDDLNQESDPRMQYVATADLDWWKPENGMLTRYRTPDYIAVRKRAYSKMMEEIPQARALGVRFLAGTDITIPFTYPGFSLHDELGLFVEAGLTPMQAIETATTNPARLLGLSDTWGRVQEGYVANLVLLDADPLLNIGNTKKIRAVVVNGEWLDRTRLDRLLEGARAKK